MPTISDTHTDGMRLWGGPPCVCVVCVCVCVSGVCAGCVCWVGAGGGGGGAGDRDGAGVLAPEDAEPPALVRLFLPKVWASRPVGTRRLKSDVRLFLCSGASGVVTVRGVRHSPPFAIGCRLVATGCSALGAGMAWHPYLLLSYPRACACACPCVCTHVGVCVLVLVRALGWVGSRWSACCRLHKRTWTTNT
jgi:hypothetical protein